MRIFARFLSGWIQYRRTYDALNRLDDRLIEDLGMTRADLEDCVRTIVRRQEEARPEATRRDAAAAVPSATPALAAWR